MSIRILNCGTIRPYFPHVESGVSCLLVETNDGPVLVDTGFGVNVTCIPVSECVFSCELCVPPAI